MELINTQLQSVTSGFCYAGDDTRGPINPDSVRIDGCRGTLSRRRLPAHLAPSRRPPEVRLATPREIPIQFESLEGGANRHGRGSAGRRQVGPRARASSKACLHPPGRIRRGGARRARGRSWKRRLGRGYGCRPGRLPSEIYICLKIARSHDRTATGSRYAFSAVAPRSVVWTAAAVCRTMWYFYSISSATAVREAAAPEDRVL